MNTRSVSFILPVSRRAARTAATPSSTDNSDRHWFVGSIVPTASCSADVIGGFDRTGDGLSDTSASLNDGAFEVVIPSHRGSDAYFAAGWAGACGAKYERYRKSGVPVGVPRMNPSAYAVSWFVGCSTFPVR